MFVQIHLRNPKIIATMSVVRVGNEEIVETVAVDIDEGRASPISKDIAESRRTGRLYVTIFGGSL